MKKLVISLVVLVFVLVAPLTTMADEATKRDIKLIHYEVREGDLQ